MSTESTRVFQPARQSFTVPVWLSVNPIKRVAMLFWAVLLALGGATIHFLNAPGQMAQSVLLAALLFGCALVQVIIALAIVIFPVRRLIIIAASINVATVLLWIVAHTIGFPIGFTMWRPEELSISDFFAPLMEGLAALLLLGLLIRRPRMTTPKAWRTILAALPALLLVGPLTGLLSISWLGPNPAASEAWLPSSMPVSAPVGQTTTLSYCNLGVGGSPLAMDISEPAAQATRPAPMVFYIHGGEGLTGFRQLSLDQDSIYLAQLRSDLLNRGFVVGSIDYGLVPRLYSSRNQIEDTRCAVRFLRAHATDLGIDPQRIGVYGTSQGGYLSAMLGTSAPNKSFDVGPYLNQSSRVQAVVDMWGYTDLTNFSGSPGWFGTIAALNTGGKSVPGSARAGSPITYVAPDDPPFLIIHGADDWFIAPHHSQELAQRLHAVGVPATLVMVQHDGHGLDAPTAGQVEQPSPDTLVQMINNFFVKTLAA